MKKLILGASLAFLAVTPAMADDQPILDANHANNILFLPSNTATGFNVFENVGNGSNNTINNAPVTNQTTVDMPNFLNPPANWDGYEFFPGGDFTLQTSAIGNYSSLNKAIFFNPEIGQVDVYSDPDAAPGSGAYDIFLQLMTYFGTHNLD